MQRKNLTYISSFFCLISFCASHAAQISYNAIINQANPHTEYVNNSDFARSFQELTTRTEKINHLLELNEKKNDTFYALKMRDIPQKEGLPPTTATIKIFVTNAEEYQRDLALYKISIKNKNQKLLNITLEGDNTINMLWLMEQNYGFVNELNTFNNISGSTIMRLFDGLCSLCSVGTVILKDESVLPEALSYPRTTKIELKILYPYIWGETVYERYGFKPYRLTDKQGQDYYAARDFLTKRPLTAFLEDFKESKETYNALHEGYNELSNFPEHLVALDKATIRDALYVPYVRIKTVKKDTIDPITKKSQKYYVELLETIYKNCLFNYTSQSNSFNTQSIKNLQKKMRKPDFYQKEYK